VHTIVEINFKLDLRMGESL